MVELHKWQCVAKPPRKSACAVNRRLTTDLTFRMESTSSSTSCKRTASKFHSCSHNLIQQGDAGIHTRTSGLLSMWSYMNGNTSEVSKGIWHFMVSRQSTIDLIFKMESISSSTCQWIRRKIRLQISGSGNLHECKNETAILHNVQN